ncbi:MAG: cytochrome b N-terminal domain-containing protein [Thermodesulfobacteriota bacterium]
MKRILLETKWGAMSLVALYVSILSGVVLALQYDEAHPFYSAASLDLLIPFGSFWRSLHFYSSQVFFLLSLVHLAAILDGQGNRLSPGRWVWLIASVPLALLLLFTGYVLRGDATGESAGLIAENICLSIPLFGSMLNSLLFAVTEEGMKRVYANHVIGLGVLWVIFTWDHLRRYRVGLSEHSWFILGIFVFSLLFQAPMEPMQMGVFHIAGPWFFLGLQELLRYMQPFVAGVMVPLAFMISLALLQTSHGWGKSARLFAGSWLLLYTGITLVALGR